jgi:hypothetical protein
MNDEPKGALNLRDFPKDLILQCKRKALNSTPPISLRQFVEKALKAAVDDKAKRAKP